MITLICGTNRPDSNTDKVARSYGAKLSEQHVEHQYFNLYDLPDDLFQKSMYAGEHSEAWKAIQEKYLISASHFIFVFPEYNGSFPGILKAFIDASDVRNCWHNKSACLVGVSSGRAGNLRGMEHFTNILNHLRINVLHLKIPISGLEDVLDEHGTITKEETIKMIEDQIRLFKTFH